MTAVEGVWFTSRGCHLRAKTTLSPEVVAQAVEKASAGSPFGSSVEVTGSRQDGDFAVVDLVVHEPMRPGR